MSCLCRSFPFLRLSPCFLGTAFRSSVVGGRLWAELMVAFGSRCRSNSIFFSELAGWLDLYPFFCAAHPRRFFCSGIWSRRLLAQQEVAWYLEVKFGLLKAKTLFTEGRGFFAFFSDQAMFDPWSLVDHRRGDSTPHSSRQRKRSRNHRLLLQQCTHTKLFLHRLLQLWSPQFVEAPSRFYSTVRLAHAIKTGLRSIRPVNLFWWICNRSLGYLVVSSVPG